VVEDCVRIQAREDHLGGLLEDSHFADARVDLGHEFSSGKILTHYKAYISSP